MIGADLDAARAMLADLTALQPCSGASNDIVALCADVTQTVSSGTFPGALVPVIDSAGSMQISSSQRTTILSLMEPASIDREAATNTSTRWHPRRAVDYAERRSDSPVEPRTPN